MLFSRDAVNLCREAFAAALAADIGEKSTLAPRNWMC